MREIGVKIEIAASFRYCKQVLISLIYSKQCKQQVNIMINMKSIGISLKQAEEERKWRFWAKARGGLAVCR